jgi:hypothetical protein
MSNQVSQGEELSWDHIFLEDLGYNISTRRMYKELENPYFFGNFTMDEIALKWGFPKP